MSRLRRLLLIPRVVWDGARSFWSWLFISKSTREPTEIQDRNRLTDFLGWLSPDMEPHWKLYEDDPSFHNRKNLGSEQARLDSQRAYKFNSFLIVALIVVAMVSNLLQALLWWLL